LHPIVVVIVGMAAGAFWAAIAGVLKAYTGAHEVITTIMLNYVGYYLVFWMLSTKGLLQAPGSNNPKSPPMLETAVFPPLLGDQYNLHVGFLISIAAVVLVWWILERSSLGFSFRAVGLNPRAAETAGINTKRVTIIAMSMSGALLGLAGVQQVLGTVTTGFSAGIDAGIGFDAITVALLGRSKPWGILAAGILFGAFKAGGYSMQAAEGIQIDIVVVVQALIVLFLAAPPLIRAMFRLPDPSAPRKIKEAKA
ncbi:MAG TPA: ABC transporter permease, partial [Microbacteriaceae bacterium]|nr:ABC transporter permease [Microbacteriaceae bacterium]